VFYKEKKEPAKVEMLQTLRNLIQMYFQIKLSKRQINPQGFHEIASK
jgi:hypothetical protein